MFSVKFALDLGRKIAGHLRFMLQYYSNWARIGNLCRVSLAFFFNARHLGDLRIDRVGIRARYGKTGGLAAAPKIKSACVNTDAESIREIVTGEHQVKQPQQLVLQMHRFVEIS